MLAPAGKVLGFSQGPTTVSQTVVGRRPWAAGSHLSSCKAGPLTLDFKPLWLLKRQLTSARMHKNQCFLVHGMFVLVSNMPSNN